MDLGRVTIHVAVYQMTFASGARRVVHLAASRAIGVSSEDFDEPDLFSSASLAWN